MRMVNKKKFDAAIKAVETQQKIVENEKFTH